MVQHYSSHVWYFSFFENQIKFQINLMTVTLPNCFITLNSPLSICLLFDDCRFTRLPTSLADLHRSSADHLHNIIRAVHPVSPPCPPICLRTLLLSDLNHSFTLHLPDETVLVCCFSLRPLPTSFDLRLFFSALLPKH